MKNIITLVLLFLTFSINAQSTKEIQKAFEKSYAFEKENNFTEAINSIKGVYSEDSYEVNLRLGWLSYQNGDLSSSEEYYSKAIDILPYSEEAKFGLILPKTANAKWEDVKAIYKQILTISPNNTIANYKLGYIYYNQRNFAYAKSLFEKVINLYPFDYDALLMYAWSNLQLGRFKEARILFNKVLMLSPNDASALEGLAIVDKK